MSTTLTSCLLRDGGLPPEIDIYHLTVLVIGILYFGFVLSRIIGYLLISAEESEWFSE